AVVSLDEGATTPQGAINVGDMMIEQLVDAPVPDGMDAAPIKWEVFDSEEAVTAAFADNELFGALTIPADYTQSQALAQLGKGDAPSVEVVLDNAKSPLAAAQLQAMLGAMLGQLEIPVRIALFHTGDAEAAPTSPMAG